MIFQSGVALFDHLGVKGLKKNVQNRRSKTSRHEKIAKSLSHKIKIPQVPQGKNPRK
jgi:hypothetical protein